MQCSRPATPQHRHSYPSISRVSPPAPLGCRNFNCASLAPIKAKYFLFAARARRRRFGLWAIIFQKIFCPISPRNTHIKTVPRFAPLPEPSLYKKQHIKKQRAAAKRNHFAAALIFQTPPWRNFKFPNARILGLCFLLRINSSDSPCCPERCSNAD